MAGEPIQVEREVAGELDVEDVARRSPLRLRDRGHVATVGDDALAMQEPERQLDLPWRSDLPGRVDCGYPELRVLIEWDSRKHHLIEAQFEEDRRRDDDAVAHGWRPLRFTWKMLHQEVEWVWAKVAGARHHAGLDAGRAA